ncbi:hypothetical protein GW17_00041872 [Ensete ventricosum]|nr:hypothetical protein GW17_00041872 [Ensete ventricosum]
MNGAKVGGRREEKERDTGREGKKPPLLPAEGDATAAAAGGRRCRCYWRKTLPLLPLFACHQAET